MYQQWLHGEVRDHPCHTVNLGNWATVVLIETDRTGNLQSVLEQWFVRPLVSRRSTCHLLHDGCSISCDGLLHSTFLVAPVPGLRLYNKGLLERLVLVHCV